MCFNFINGVYHLRLLLLSSRYTILVSQSCIACYHTSSVNSNAFVYMLSGSVLVHGQNMVKGQVAFMPVTAMRQQSRREWYVNVVCNSILIVEDFSLVLFQLVALLIDCCDMVICSTMRQRNEERWPRTL